MINLTSTIRAAVIAIPAAASLPVQKMLGEKGVRLDGEKVKRKKIKIGMLCTFT